MFILWNKFLSYVGASAPSFAIIGGGPNGLCLAILLLHDFIEASRPLKLTLFEKRTTYLRCQRVVFTCIPELLSAFPTILDEIQAQGFHRKYPSIRCLQMLMKRRLLKLAQTEGITFQWKEETFLLKTHVRNYVACFVCDGAQSKIRRDLGEANLVSLAKFATYHSRWNYFSFYDYGFHLVIYETNRRTLAPYKDTEPQQIMSGISEEKFETLLASCSKKTPGYFRPVKNVEAFCSSIENGETLRSSMNIRKDKSFVVGFARDRYTFSGTASVEHEGSQIFFVGDSLFTVPVTTGKGMGHGMRSASTLSKLVVEAECWQSVHDKYEEFACGLAPFMRMQSVSS